MNNHIDPINLKKIETLNRSQTDKKELSDLVGFVQHHVTKSSGHTLFYFASFKILILSSIILLVILCYLKRKLNYLSLEWKKYLLNNESTQNKNVVSRMINQNRLTFLKENADLIWRNEFEIRSEKSRIRLVVSLLKSPKFCHRYWIWKLIWRVL